MTKKRDLKRLVRERQARTGESYVTARRHVLAQAANGDGAEPVAHAAESPPVDEPGASRPSIPVVEMISLTEQGAQLGLKCRITMASPLAAQVDPTVALTRLRDVLVASAHDPGLALLRGVVLHGESAPPPPLPRGRTMWQQEVRRFIERARAGIGGVSETGSMIALNVDGLAGSVLLIAHVGFRPFLYPKPTTAGPRLVLTTVQELTMGPGAGAIMMAP